MARCTSAAATEESTPPDSPQITCAWPTCFAILPIEFSTKDPGVQAGSHLQMAKRKFEMISAPRGVCATSGWNCTPYSLRSLDLKAATGSVPVDATVAKP